VWCEVIHVADSGFPGDFSCGGRCVGLAAIDPDPLGPAGCPVASSSSLIPSLAQLLVCDACAVPAELQSLPLMSPPSVRVSQVTRG
jgi:hypothetical protein